ncbi:FkbM family methyltransferase [Alienimonas californiensis]|uniref:Vibrio cholerae RfbT protein n=1 Tax=Alienimonas californiensis TaxID=2527989 RepID=A0A517P7Z0_9PLAN|nr:FkbM family methyltransferase [Alienimonas californiensis]QDT15491.1 Vibrio cholerae RfbT protein [Alienimonas californiensis]
MSHALLWIAGKLPRGLIRAVSRSQWRHPLIRKGVERLYDLFRGRDGVIQGGVGAGLRFNPGPSHAGYLLGTTEPEIQRLLAELINPGDTVADVGANVGYLTTLAARLVGGETSGGGRVVAIEPLEENVRWIRHNVALNAGEERFGRIDVRCEALGAADGTATFQLSEVSTWGRLESAGSAPNQPAGTRQVPVRSLDSLRAEGVFGEPPSLALLKIDVEGAEADVLAGGRETLRALRPLLLVELHGTAPAVAAELDRAGYHAAVVGGAGVAAADAPWAAYLLAAPRDDAALCARVDRLCAAAAETR